MKHAPAVAPRDLKTAQFHTKSWSYSHTCPVCGRQRRYNRNFLGARFVLVCDGERWDRDNVEAWKAAEVTP